MDKSRVQAYLDLIKTLLTCPSGEEAQILQANSELVDEGLVEVMQQVVEQMPAEGNGNIANRLRNLTAGIVRMLKMTTSASPEEYFQFLMQVLQATRDSHGHPEVVYPLLQANLDRLDDGFTLYLQYWATQALPKVELEQAQVIAADLAEFGNLIQEFPLGNKASNMETAIAAYQHALQVLTSEAFPSEWAITQNNLANAYSHRIRGEKTQNLEMAIEYYQHALQVLTREAFPSEWAMTQNNLVTAYNHRIRGERAQNLEKAIESCNKALAVFTREAFPSEWAMTQNNLGTAYSQRIRGERAQNLEMAIAAYEKALEVRTRQAFPLDWAITQKNLAAAYSHRIRGKRAQNLEKAIESCNKALAVLTREAFPSEWAMTQNNLANAYNHRIQGEKAENLETAIDAYKKALQVDTRQAFPLDWATTQNNLGTAYSQRIQGDKAKNLEMAIAAYEKALEVRTRQAFPLDWATTQNNLAIAYRERIQGDKAENLEMAIAACKKALEVRTRQAFPLDWATTQNNLAAAYRERIQGDKAENLEMAIAAYEKALEVRTRQAFPQNHIETLFNLGLVYRDAQQWQQAYDTFSAAINTVESLREEIVSGDESKQKLAEEWNQLYLVIVETCLQLDRPTEALQYAECSKTRNLIEQILLRDSDTLFPPEVATELTQLRKDIARKQSQIQQSKVENYAKLAQRLQDLRQQRNQLQDTYLPVGSSFRFDSFRTTLDSRTAVIEWYIASGTFLAFIITNDPPLTIQRGKELESESTLIKEAEGIFIWQSTPDDYQALFKWANTYLQTYKEQKDTWRNKLAHALQNLAQILHLDELLTHLPSSCHRLILIPHRFLHLFPLHALPIKNEKLKIKNLPPATEPRYLLDIFPKGVSYAPSCQLLQQVQKRQRPDFDTLFAIQTPTSDLYDSDLGTIEVIQKQFANSDILSKEQASKSTLLPEDKATQTLTQYEKLQTAHSLFFFCHGYFNPNSPLDSGLQLADDNLTLAEIILHFRLDNCRLVTLSACETGLVDFNNSSDEYIGLPNGFLLAGSRAVLSSLWTVQSLSTALLVVRVYQNLKSGESLAVALQKSQSWLRNATKTDLEVWGNDNLPNANHRRQLKIFLRQQETEKPFASPDHWAAFCAVGE